MALYRLYLVIQNRGSMLTNLSTNGWITFHTDYRLYLIFGGKSAIFCTAIFYKSISRLVTVYWNLFCHNNIVLSSGKRRCFPSNKSTPVPQRNVGSTTPSSPPSHARFLRSDECRAELVGGLGDTRQILG